MLAISNIVQKAIVLLLALIIVTAGLLLGPGNQAYDLTPYLPNAVDRAMPTALTGGVSVALANKRCPPRAHNHRTNDPLTTARWFTKGRPTQAGPNQLRYKWYSQANYPGARAWFKGTKVC